MNIDYQSQDVCFICLQGFQIEESKKPENSYENQENDQLEDAEVLQKSHAYPSNPDSCRHRFHKSCIITWLTSKTVCPVCQNEVLWINILIPDTGLIAYKNYREKIQNEEYLQKQEKELILQLQREKEEETNNNNDQSSDEEEEQEENQDNQQQNGWLKNEKLVENNLKYQRNQKQKQENKNNDDKKNAKNKNFDMFEDFPTLGGELIQKAQIKKPKKPKMQNQKMVNTLTMDKQSTIQGNTEIITIQEINENCKINPEKSLNSDIEGNLDKNGLLNPQNLSAYDLILFKEAQIKENNIDCIDHTFLKGEISQLDFKYQQFYDILDFKQVDFQALKHSCKTIQKLEEKDANYITDLEDLCWYIIQEIDKKLEKLHQITKKMLKFDCQQIMYDIDCVDKELEWGRNQKFDYLFDQYKHQYIQQKKNNYNKIIWDYQTVQQQQNTNHKNNNNSSSSQNHHKNNRKNSNHNQNQQQQPNKQQPFNNKHNNANNVKKNGRQNKKKYSMEKQQQQNQQSQQW